MKVITDMFDRAIYFPRSPIPYIKGKDMWNISMSRLALIHRKIWNMFDN